METIYQAENDKDVFAEAKTYVLPLDHISETN